MNALPEFWAAVLGWLDLIAGRNDAMGKFKAKDIVQISSTMTLATSNAPAHCRVTGVLAPEIAFEVSLPAKWNGRFYMIGNGGHAGEFMEDPGRVNPLKQWNKFSTESIAQGYEIAYDDDKVQIETALGYSIHQTFSSDYRTVSTALNSGVPLSLSNHSELSSQFGSFTRHLLGVQDDVKVEPERRKAFLGLL